MPKFLRLITRDKNFENMQSNFLDISLKESRGNLFLKDLTCPDHRTYILIEL